MKLPVKLPAYLVFVDVYRISALGSLGTSRNVLANQVARSHGLTINLVLMENSKNSLTNIRKAANDSVKSRGVELIITAQKHNDPSVWYIHSGRAMGVR